MNSFSATDRKMRFAEMIFCSVVYPTKLSEINSLLLAESLRTFTSASSELPIWFFFPNHVNQLTQKTHDRLVDLDVTLIPFKINRDQLRFFFAGAVRAVALAEVLCAGNCNYLAWMDTNTVVLQEPEEFTLPENKSLGYRPVHHLLLGSRFDRPLDSFWSQIYHCCNVPPERVFPMKPVVEDLRMRPYFNAGIIVTRPELGLFQSWRDMFYRYYQAPGLQQFYKQDDRYVIFMHQAILSGVILNKFQKENLLELPWTYNYPLHLFDQDETDYRPASLENLVTFRHEGFYQDPDWRVKMPADEPLKDWLADRVI
ncbi:MAG: hypothetical protein U9R58_15940 [Chloroflexota bacterium]|nr:hypothetical protein [Chloroflexota bacterium]